MKVSIVFIALMSICSLSFTNPAHLTDFRNWKKLGSKKVNYQLDRDVVKVGWREGGFTKLKLVVTNGSLNMHRMVIEYRDGSKQRVALSQQFKKGSDSRIIDLQGRKRIIKDITFWYDSKNISRNRATVHVFGRH